MIIGSGFRRADRRRSVSRPRPGYVRTSVIGRCDWPLSPSNRDTFDSIWSGPATASLLLSTSEIEGIEPGQPSSRMDCDFAQRGPGAPVAVDVDGRDALRADRKFRLVWIVDDDLHRVLALRDSRRRRLVFGDLVARQILPLAVGLPDAVDVALEDLAGIEIECDLDELTGAHVFEVLLEVGREQVTVGACDQGGDSADTQDACHHARAHLKVDEEAVLGCP